MSLNLWLSSGSPGIAFFSNVGSLLQGLTELLTVIGAGVGFILRSRRRARRDRLRTEAAAALAARKAKETLEQRLEQQHQVQIDQMREQARELDSMHKTQMALMEGQLEVQQRINNELIKRILDGDDDDDKS